MTQPAVSWVIPVYNGADFLTAALTSVAAQTFSDFEAIVLNDGSHDASSEIAHCFATRDPRFRVIDKLKGGLVDTLNQGVALARAPLIARMDADDICLPERLERQVAYLAANPDCVALGALSIIIDEHGVEQRRTTRAMVVPAGPGAPPFPPERYRITHPTAIFRREICLAVGGYSHDFQAAEDYELWLRMSERGRIKELREPLLRYRVHSRSITAQLPDRQRLSCLRADLVTTLRRAGIAPEMLVSLRGELPIEEILRVVETIPGAPPSEIVRLRYDADRLRSMIYRGSSADRRRLAAELSLAAARTAAANGWRSSHRAAICAAGREVARWMTVSLLGKTR